MVKIVILYPNKENARFDMHYYVENHMPTSISLLSAHPGFRGVSVERGLEGSVPGSKPEYVAICEYLFNSAEEFLQAFLPHAELLQGDMPKYTDITPIIQINEVLIAQ
jgi:uncharacterized protein (TIGR02118 family)